MASQDQTQSTGTHHEHGHKEHHEGKASHIMHAIVDNFTEAGARAASGFAPVSDQSGQDHAVNPHTRTQEVGDGIKSVTAEVPQASTGSAGTGTSAATGDVKRV